MPAWLTFLFSAAAIAAAGDRLARDGDVLARGIGLGDVWVGALVVAAVTSFPELTIGVSAVLQRHPDLAVGTVFGSCMANMLILAVADLHTRRPRFLVREVVDRAALGALGSLLCLIASLGILLDERRIDWIVGRPTLVIGVAFLAGAGLLHADRDASPLRSGAVFDRDRPSPVEMRPALARFLVAATVIVAATPIVVASLARWAAQLSITDGLAGMVLLAVPVALPDAAVTVGSIRADAFGPAVGDLFGSNCFNVAALVALDLAYDRGSLLAAADPSLALAALFAALLMGLAVLELLGRSKQRVWSLAPGSTFLLLTYVLGLLAVYEAAQR